MVVGQGNPGEAYARTRHNVGFMVLDRLGLEFRRKGEALLAEAEVEAEGAFSSSPSPTTTSRGRRWPPWPASTRSPRSASW